MSIQGYADINTPDGWPNVKASLRYIGGSFTYPATASQMTPLNNLFITKGFDDANAWNGATATWTCPLNGLYLFVLRLGINAGATCQVNHQWTKNGTQVFLCGISQAAGYNEYTSTFLDRAVVGDSYVANSSSSIASMALRAGIEDMMAIALLGP